MLVVQYIMYSDIFKTDIIFHNIYGKIPDLCLVPKGTVTKQIRI